MAKKYTWNVKLRPNAFTPDNDRDQLADVEPNGATKHDEDVADAIIAGGQRCFAYPRKWSLYARAKGLCRGLQN